ncbi:uncharacterized protein IL334_003112 [Kwoniella shivajii]|uniref:Cyclin N-terminal domain-containing protein n=1 Tax=Kwoniella shivajii TaxID=564305 RepID=A0ABZ1CWM4_9TREE|nr:hypothetical protein IL334_003112 [Kwoniella shivajii]
MPYIYDRPNGRDVYASRQGEYEESSDVKLLKLLNCAPYQNHVDAPLQNESFELYGYTHRAEEEDDSDVSGNALACVNMAPSELLTILFPHSPSPTFNVAISNAFHPTPFADPPFIVVLMLLRTARSSIIDHQDDFIMQKRYPRMSFNGRSYPPVPPDASTLPRLVDVWTPENVLPARDYEMHAHNHSDLAQQDRSFVQPAPTYSRSNANVYGYESDAFVNSTQDVRHFNPQQQSVWTPPDANGWSNAYNVDFRAPVLHPRLVHLPERPFTPHDTYRYPTSHVEQIYVAPAVPEVPTETINAAFAVWYANQVVGLLVTPGSFRPGVGGASDEIWGMGGREKDAWLRVGRSPPDYSKAWGRMGMNSTPVPTPRRLRQRRPDLEPQDPWNVAWAHSVKPSSSFVNYILDMIQRMTISPTALVSAVWFLAGLGLHDGDGLKGAELRDFLRDHRSYELESIERRVATLGLMLSGKWLDDNSFLTKSWFEVTTIPIKQLDRMERIALADLNFSLHVPVSSWADHVNKHYTALICKPIADEVDLVVTPMIDDMVTEARDVELEDPQDIALPPPVERRLSSEELPAAADQAISRDWGDFARSYGISQWDTRDMEVDAELERAERSVDALVNDEYPEEEDEEYLDYDGAKKWLPSISELERSGSNSSDTSFSSHKSHVRGVIQPTQPFHVPLDISETSPRQRSYSDWTNDSSISNRSHDWESSDFLYPIATSDKCQECDDCVPSSFTQQSAYSTSRSNLNSGYIEPGITVVSPPKYNTMDGLNDTQMTGPTYGGYGSTSKRWGRPIGAAQW